MVSAGSYLLGAAALSAVALSLGFSAFCLRRGLLPGWQGAPARLVEVILAIALLIWISEILGTFSLFYAGTLVSACLLLAVIVAWKARASSAADAVGAGSGATTLPPSPGEGIRNRAAMSLITVGVIAVVFADWGLTTKQALDQGIFNFDSLWYHMPFAVDMVQSHSVTGLHYIDTVFTNWFYPQNSELLHAVGILLTHRDTLSLFINFGWLAIAFLAAWCIGRPYGRGHLTVAAAAIVLECHTLVVREPGAAKNDLAAAALLLASIAILINAWAQQRASEALPGEGRGSLPVGWPLALAGLAGGLAVGTRDTALAMAAALTVAVVVLAPPGRRRAAAMWWFVPALLGGGFWYLRNLIAAGNPLPEIAHLGPISLPHPEQLQTARPGFSISHYMTDTAVWREYFAPGLHQAFGVLWPLVVGGAVLAAALALLRGRDRAVRWIGAVALFGMLIYLFTPLSAAGAQGAPVAFAINVRFVIPALLAGIVLAPLARCIEGERRQWALMGALLLVLIVTDRSDAALRDPSRVFAWLLVALVVLVPAALLLARHRRRRARRRRRRLCRARAHRGGDRLPGAARLPARPLPAPASPACTSMPPIAGRATRAAPASALPAPLRDSSSTASMAPTSPTASSTWAPRDRTEPSIPFPPVESSAPRSTPPASTTSSPPHSSTSSTPTTRSPRPRRAGCAVRQPSFRSSAAGR